MTYNFYPAAVRTALEVRPASASDFDDLVQEGVIAAWLATEARPELRDAQVYGNVVANRKVKGMLSGRYGAFGSDTSSKTYEPMRHSGRITVEDDAPELAADPAQANVDTFDEVAAAVRALPEAEDRQAIFLLFWRDLDRKQAAEALGISHIALNRRWTNRIRPFLRAQLAA